MSYRWEKLGRVFDPTAVPDRPWLKEFAQAPATLVLDDRVRVYFSCRPPADAHGQYVSYSAFVDLDRQDLTRVIEVSRDPILPLGGRGEFDEFGTYPVSVIPWDDHLIAYYAGWTRCVSVPFDVAIGMARSHDGGVTWVKEGRGPVIPYSLHEPFVMSGPKIRRFGDALTLFYIAGTEWVMDGDRPEPVYTIRMAHSSDAVNWTKHGREIIPSRLEDGEAQASPDVIRSGGRFHMFFCFRHTTGYRSHARGYRIGYAHSDDGVRWVRDDARAGLHVSLDGWDSEMVSYPHVFELDGATYMMYLGNQVGRYGFGLARLEGTL